MSNNCKNTCDKCKHFHRTGTNYQRVVCGECRRHPPQSIGDIFMRPPVTGEDWCGEFEATDGD